ncbi:MAG: PaaI family thioesterase [Leptospirales bacterium]|nr:PaaI family thioesterase [Leptospirales bacterium]
MEMKGIVGPSQTARDWHHTNCFGCGIDNARGLHAEFPFDETSGEVRFDHIPDRFQEGAPGYAHGGVLAALLDEAQGTLCYHVGHLVMTQQLHIKYHKATPLNQPITVRCWLTAVRKRRIYTRASIHSASGELLASSSAGWYALPERMAQKLFADRYSAEDSERNRLILEANRKRAQKIRRRLRESIPSNQS